MTATQTPRLTRRTLLESLAALSLAAAIGAGSTTPAAAQATPATDLVGGNTAFALALHAALRESATGNLLVSPFSVSQALAMTYAGARGETATQMAGTLAFRPGQVQHHVTHRGAFLPP